MDSLGWNHHNADDAQARTVQEFVEEVMSRAFVKGSTQYVHTGTTAPGGITTAPWSCMMWAYFTDVDSTEQVFWFLGDSGDGNDSRWDLQLTASNELRFLSKETTTNTITGSVLSANTWYHIGVIAAASNDVRLYLNGTEDGNSTNTKIPAGVDRWAIGARAGSPAGRPASLRAFWPALYNVELSTSHMQMLSDGKSPLRVRREDLVFFPKFERDEDYDVIGGTSLTTANTPTVAGNPPGLIRAIPRGRSRTYSRR